MRNISPFRHTCRITDPVSECRYDGHEEPPSPHTAPHTPHISTAGGSAHPQSPPASGPSRSSSPGRAQRASFRRADSSTGVRRAYLPTYFSLLSLHLPRVQTRIHRITDWRASPPTPHTPGFKRLKHLP